MTAHDRDVKRLELQIGQLISIVANQNKRLNRIEDIERKRNFGNVHIIPFAERG